MAKGSNVGSLNIMVGANIRRLNQNFNRAAMSVRKFGSTVISIGTGMAKYTAVTLAAVTGIGVVMVKRQMAAIDSTSKFSDVVGLSTEKMVGYQRAAKITGVEQSQLNTAIVRFLKNMGDAEAGLATPIRALERLGVRFEDLQNLDTDEKLKLIADRFTTLDDPVARASAMIDLFGRSGVAMGKLMEQGSKGIDAFHKQVADAGLAFTRGEGARIEAANDAMARLGDQFSAIWRRVTIAVAPSIERIARVITHMVATSRQQFTRLLNSTIRPVFESIQRVILHNWNAVLSATVSTMRGMWDVVRTTFGALYNLAATVFGAIGGSGATAFNSVGDAARRMTRRLADDINTLAFVFKSWDDILALFVLKTESQFVQFGKNVAHVWKQVTDVYSQEQRVWTRPMSEQEQILNQTIDNLQRTIGTKLHDFLDDERRKAKQTADDIGAFFANALDTSMDLPAFAGPSFDEFGEQFGEAAFGRARDSALQLIRAGSAEAMAAQHDMNRRANREANMQKQQLDAQKKTAANTSTIAKRIAANVQQQPVTVTISG